ncbi:MAG: DUF2975 domain-containing protein [Clostridia bacterium]|nr:DUF2975 domain-containing protein [Clostridia bacterium]
MKKRSCFGLWTAVWMLAVIGTFVFAFFVPFGAKEIISRNSSMERLFWPYLAYLWAVGIMYYWVIFEFSRVVKRISLDASFCRENARSMKNISAITLATGIWFLMGLALSPLFGAFSMGLLAARCIFAAICFTISLFAHALSRLILRAAEIKAENDLTV